MITLRVHNTVTYIDGWLDKEIKTLLRMTVGYADENAKHRARMNPGYDGTITTLCYGYGPKPCKCFVKKSGMHFPSGLLKRVRDLFTANNVQHQIVDERGGKVTSTPFTMSPSYEDRDYQTGIVQTAIQRNRGIIKLCTGGGKCLQETDVCLTEHGMLTMGELGAGLEAGESRALRSMVASPLTPSGREVTSDVYRDGLGVSRKYTTSFGFTSTATPKHRIKVVAPDGAISWKQVSDLAEGDWAVICREQQLFGADTSLSLEQAYFLGLISGDGTWTLKTSAKNGVKLSTQDPHLRSFFLQYAKNNGIHAGCCRDLRRAALETCSIYNKSRADWLKKVLPPALATEKVIPRSIRQSQKSIVAGFIRGLYETDGWVGREKGKPNVCIGLSSKTMIDQLHVLLLNFGIVASRRLKYTTHADSHILTIYRSSLDRFVSEIGFDPAGWKCGRLKDEMSRMEGIAKNANRDVIPHQRRRLESIISRLREIFGQRQTKQILDALCQDANVNPSTLRSWVGDRAWRSPSRDSLSRFLEVLYSYLVSQESAAKELSKAVWATLSQDVDDILSLCNPEFYFDPIETIEETVTDNYDFVVPETHSFVAQGFINHNTSIAASIIAKLGAVPFVFFVPSKDLLKQAVDEFQKFIWLNGAPVTVGAIGAGRRETADITVMTMQTAVRAIDPAQFANKRKKSKLVIDEDGEIDDSDNAEDGLDGQALEDFRNQVRDLLKRCKGFIFDECQFAASITATTICDFADNARYRYGLSATPWRDMGDDLVIDACFGSPICDINASFLINHPKKYLVQPTIYFVPMNNLRGHRFDTYDEAYGAGIIDNTLRNTRIANISQSLMSKGRMVLNLVKNVEHGHTLERMIPNSVFVHGSLSSKVRDSHLAAMRAHKAPVTIATGIYDQGIDCKPLDAVILAGGGKSKTRALQRIGRAIRPYSCDGYVKKDAIIVDFHDDLKWLRDHSEIRRRVYATEPNFIMKEMRID